MGRSLIDRIVTEISPERMRNEILRYFNVLDQDVDLPIDTENSKYIRINKSINIEVLIRTIRIDDEEIWPFRVLVRINSVAARDGLALESKFLLYLDCNLNISTCDSPHIEPDQEENIQHLN
jgi:hypothetical protein